MCTVVMKSPSNVHIFSAWSDLTGILESQQARPHYPPPPMLVVKKLFVSLFAVFSEESCQAHLTAGVQTSLRFFDE